MAIMAFPQLQNNTGQGQFESGLYTFDDTTIPLLKTTIMTNKRRDGNTIVDKQIEALGQTEVNQSDWGREEDAQEEIPLAARILFNLSISASFAALSVSIRLSSSSIT